MTLRTTIKVLIDQRGNSNKIWAQVVTISNGKKSPVIHGPIRRNGAGLVENQSSATWHDKEQKGYQLLATFQGVPHGMERACVAAVAHVKAGESPALFDGASPQETAFAKGCAVKFLAQGNWGGHGFTVDLSNAGSEATPVEPPEPERGPRAPMPVHDLSQLLKTTRRSEFF